MHYSKLLALTQLCLWSQTVLKLMQKLLTICHEISGIKIICKPVTIFLKTHNIVSFHQHQYLLQAQRVVGGGGWWQWYI